MRGTSSLKKKAGAVTNEKLIISRDDMCHVTKTHRGGSNKQKTFRVERALNITKSNYRKLSRDIDFLNLLP